MEFGLKTFGLIAGLTTDVGLDVLVVGVDDVLVVMAGFVAVADVGLVVAEVNDVLGAKVILGVEEVFVILGLLGTVLVTAEVIGL
jgi:hypothetical protein